MHNIKDIRQNPDIFKEELSKRFVNIDLKKILSLDEINRKLIQDKETLEKEKKDISKNKDSSLFEKSKKISKQISIYIEQQNSVKKELDDILSSIPNIALKDVPVGQDDSSNKEISKSGEISKYKFKPKSHYELGEKLQMLDFDLATKTTGSRFVFVTDKLARLERAISNFMLDTHININGYKEVSPPLIASDSTMFGTGQLPKFENDQFEIKVDNINDRKFLIPTAEVILTNIDRKSVV